MALPALRPLDIVPVQHEGETMVCLSDPEGFVKEQLVLSPAAFFVASLLDGTNDIVDIQYQFSKHSGGRILMSDDIRTVVDYLDEHGFLQSGRFTTLCQTALQEFLEAPVRRAHLAGRSYPASAEELREYLKKMSLGKEDGVGESPSGPVAGAQPVHAIVVPHIDFERGGPCYSHGYRRLAQAPPPEFVLVFGVGHSAPQVPFILTRKHFATPLGTIETDRALVDRLAAACAWDPFESEPAHRAEHSIEFQCVMLSYLFGSGVRIVPILCGPFPCDDGSIADPSRIKEVRQFLDVCREIVEENKGKARVIAGADLAHVGKRFGDSFNISNAVIRRTETRDREDLEFVLQLDPEGWYRSVMKDGNKRRVCGLNCVYATLKSVQGVGREGELLHYAYAPDPAGGLVSFAAIAIN